MTEDLMQKGWGAVPESEKQGAVLDQLILMELKHIDPVFFNSYTQAKETITDSADRMRIDIQMFNRVAQLRTEGKMRPVEELRPIAASIAKLESGKVFKALSDFSNGLQSG